MWNKFSIKIQLIIFMTVLISIVEMSTLFIVLDIQKKDNKNNAITEATTLTKSLHNDLLKTILNPRADILSDIDFRLAAFEKINGVVLFNDEKNEIYSYKDIASIQKYKNTLISKKIHFTQKHLLVKEMIESDGYIFGYLIVDIDLSSYEAKYTILRKTILSIFVLTLLLGIILSLFLSKSYTKPFAILLDAMKRSDPTKNEIIVLHTQAKNEVKDLFDEFNKGMKQVSISTQEINSLNDEIEETQREVVFTMGAIGESRSKETGNHVKRVAEYSKMLGIYYGLSEYDAEMIQQASPMHDIGKVAIPDSILNKPGRFDDAERKVMDTHASLGYDMLKVSSRPLLKLAATVAHEHHEKWDGSGYPRGLKGEEIHIAGRITALADVFDALGSDRVYKKAWDDERIFKLFKEERGKHFDPKLIDIFFDNLDSFLEVREGLKDVTS